MVLRGGCREPCPCLVSFCPLACGGALRYGFGKASDSADLELGLSSFTGGLL